ncbi:acyltransferase family protein [Arthrobacter ginkgonis]|uniref:Acyltransferase family protein n=1 Tax=Arthrobacter ginkgonis TaxID=1630594 RepID=A0ABP7BYQ0_9MICC
MSPPQAGPAHPGRAASGKPGYRPDVQGLRALAVLMVVVYHVWLGRVSGGVDVFLLISAFLLTGSFVRKVEAGRPLRLPAYWLNLFRRLLPAAVVVLLAVLAATANLLPRSRWPEIFGQSWASLFYVQNWALAEAAVDYYAADHSTASPLQHFWSLSIQGQVFILWPLVFAACAALWRGMCVLARRHGLRAPGFRAVAAAAFGAIFAVSLAYSIQVTAADQAWAYFDTRARLWEFALGSLLALALPYAAKLPSAVRVGLGWAGLAAMLSCGIVLQVQQSFPGWVALWPTLAGAAVIAAGGTGSRFGADRLLSLRPLTRLGDISYGLYLWHWPILVIYLATRQTAGPGPAGGAAVIALSLALAWATTKAVETPLRSWRWPTVRRRRLGLVVAVLLAVVAAPLSGWEARVAAYERMAGTQTAQDNPGAEALRPGFEYGGSPAAAVLPLTTELDAEWAEFDGPCEGEYAPGDARIDQCYMAGDPATARKTVFVVGDSHAQHWIPALRPAAERNGWLVVMVHRPGCRFGAESPERDEACNGFNEAASAYVLEHRPDAVLTLASLTASFGAPERVTPGYLEGVRPWLEAGIRVAGMRDTARFDFMVPECVDLNGPESAACTVERDAAIAAESPLEELRDRLKGDRAYAGLGFFEMTDQICDDEVCRPVIGNVLVYIDQSHLSKTYTATTSPVFEERFKAALDW